MATRSCFAASILSDQTLKDAEVVERVLCPFELEHIWIWFLELNATRQNGMGVNPISFTEIKSWIDVTEKSISQFELKALRAIDQAYLIHQNEKEKKPK